MKKREGILENFFWKFSERMAAQLVSTVVSIVLARLLEPEYYGTISIVMVFITLADVFVSDGFGSALIQKKDADIYDFSSVLYFNIGFSCVLYLILFIAAPFISAFYGDGYEILTPVLRILGLRIILTAVNSVQQAYVSKRMIFRQFFFSTLSATLASAVVGIVMAYLGFGIWALVAQYLVNSFAGTLTLALSLKKKPALYFSFERIRGLIGYGARILGTNLLVTGFRDLRALIIGKKYSSADLAFYNKGAQFPNLIITNVNSSISSVLFPKMANDQNDVESVKATMKRTIRFSAFVTFPILLGFALIAEAFVSFVLTDKWLPCVPYLQLVCIGYLFYPINSANMQAIKALGKGDVYMRLEITKKIIELVVLLCTMWISAKAMVIGSTITTYCFSALNAFPNSRLINYSFKEQLCDIGAPMLMSLIMAFAVTIVGKVISANSLIVLILQIIVGATVYFSLSVITKNAEFMFIKDLIKSKLKGND